MMPPLCGCLEIVATPHEASRDLIEAF